jgi:hypothetical protein
VERFLSWAETSLAHRPVWLLAVCGAAVLQLMLILTHRPWDDEWQALLIARQTPTLASMFAQLHYEGHPQLWYLLLREVGTLVSPRWILPTINITFAGIVYWAILTRSPFRRVERLLLLLSEILLFEMLSVSRSLSLGVALIFVTLALWKWRSAWLALALLPLSKGGPSSAWQLLPSDRYQRTTAAGFGTEGGKDTCRLRRHRI